MKLLAILTLTFSVVAATSLKKDDSKQSKRTGRQFGWQTPYYTRPYDHSKVYGQKYYEGIRQPGNAVDKSLAQENIKMEKHLGAMLEIKATANKLPSIELRLKPTKVNTSLIVNRSNGKSHPVRLPAYSAPQYPPQSFYGLSNYYQQQPIQNFYGNKELPIPITSPMIPINPSSESIYDSYNPNYIGMNYNTGYGQYMAAMGHPSFGVQGQYNPSGGLLGNYNYYNNPYNNNYYNNRPVNEFENNIENTIESIITDSFQFQCPLDLSGKGHVVGQATIYPDPSTCNRFYYCQMGHAYVFQCSEELYYNPAIKACDEKQNFSCGNRVI